MTVATSLRFSIRTAVEVLRWAFAFYLGHFFLIAGISLVPAVERFVFVMWGSGFPAVVNVVLEVFVLGVRLLLLAVIIRLAIYGDDELRRLGHEERWERMKAFFLDRPSSLVVQALLIAAAVFVFDVIPERVVTLWIPDDAETLYTAILLAVKNPTVIAFTFVWMVGIVRQMMLYSPIDTPR